MWFLDPNQREYLMRIPHLMYPHQLPSLARTWFIIIYVSIPHRGVSGYPMELSLGVLRVSIIVFMPLGRGQAMGSIGKRRVCVCLY